MSPASAFGLLALALSAACVGGASDKGEPAGDTGAAAGSPPEESAPADDTSALDSDGSDTAPPDSGAADADGDGWTADHERSSA